MWSCGLYAQCAYMVDGFDQVGAIFKDIGLEVGKCRARGRKTFKSGAMVV